eukprot:2292870-Rhodomonas_salina.1
MANFYSQSQRAAQTSLAGWALSLYHRIVRLPALHEEEQANGDHQRITDAAGDASDERRVGRGVAGLLLLLFLSEALVLSIRSGVDLGRHVERRDGLDARHARELVKADLRVLALLEDREHSHIGGGLGERRLEATHGAARARDARLVDLQAGDLDGVHRGARCLNILFEGGLAGRSAACRRTNRLRPASAAA